MHASMTMTKTLLVGCVLCPLPILSAAQQDLRTLAASSLDSVVLVEVYDPTDNLAGTGSGFFVAPNEIVSNQHVVEGAHRVVVVLSDGSEIEVSGVLAVDELNDLVVLKPSQPHGSALKVARSDNLEVGQGVVVLGSPAGLSGTLSDGIVSAIRPEGLTEHTRPGEATPPVFQISAAISAGSSGSPVMDLSGEVVGVAVSQLRYGQNLNFAVPAAPLRQIIRRSAGAELQITYGTFISGSRKDYLRNVIISAVFFAAIFWVLRSKKGPKLVK